jgi:hypothetical protein
MVVIRGAGRGPQAKQGAPADPLRSSAVDTRSCAAHTDAADEPRSRDDLLILADRTLAAYLRYLARYGGSVLEQEGLLLFAGAHRQPNPYRNGALRLEPSLSAEEVVARADSFFAFRQRSYALWVREHGDDDLAAEATRQGWRELERLPELALERLPPYLPPPEGVELRRAHDQQTREDYLALVADAWGMRAMPRDVAARVFFDPDSLDVPDVAAFVAYYDGAPLSAAMTLVSDGVALGCQAATIRRPKPGQRLPSSSPPGERRGLAESCLWAALEVSFGTLAARLSLCQTSTLGAPVWQSLGYRRLTSYGRWVVPFPVRRQGSAGG